MQLRNTFGAYSCASCGNGFDKPEGESATQVLSPCCGQWSNKSSTPTMSFEAFQATRQFCRDLGKHFNDSQFDKDTTGWTYLDGTLWIQDREGEPYWLLIERDEYSSTNLDEIERALYNYAVNDGRIIEAEPPTAVPVRKASDPTRPLAKSLHTITVLENVAKAFMYQNGRIVHHPDDAMQIALNLLGLADQPDPHGLVAAARKKIEPKA